MHLTRAQSRAVDHIAIVRFLMPGIVLMENASRGCADLAWSMLGSKPGRVAVVCGSGNNGGDGLAIARHLHNRGCEVTVFHPQDPSRFSPDAAVMWRTVELMSLKRVVVDDDTIADHACELLVDAILGTGPTERVRPETASLIDAINRNPAPKLAVDLPSGLDCDTGRPLGTAVRATRTASFVGPKIGFTQADASSYTGEISVVEIGCPREIIDLAKCEA
jgi:NAD(P)H-hydrate epimerase